MPPMTRIEFLGTGVLPLVLAFKSVGSAIAVAVTAMERHLPGHLEVLGTRLAANNNDQLQALHSVTVSWPCPGTVLVRGAHSVASLAEGWTGVS